MSRKFLSSYRPGPIAINSYPRQSWLLQKRVKVWFNRDSKHNTWGTIIRCDELDDKSFDLIIVELDDGRIVLGDEVTIEF